MEKYKNSPTIDKFAINEKLQKQKQKQHQQPSHQDHMHLNGVTKIRPHHGTNHNETTNTVSSLPNSNYGTYNNHKNDDVIVNVVDNGKNDDKLADLERHLSLFDLVSIGIGGTIGSGIFVLCGLIAHSYAGPATFISWTIAGVAAMLSGFSYAELAARLPSAGSAYVYVYASMGELPAVIVAGCLTLEYVAAAAAVSRSWGEKVVEWLLDDVGVEVPSDAHGLMHFIVGSTTGGKVGAQERLFNPMAFAVSSIAVILLLKGVKESKAITNVFTMSKVGVVLFMTIGGLILIKPANLTPVIPTQFGWTGVFRGATSSFFGYLGYDEICCIAGEAKNPKKNIPYAILCTLLLSMTIYIAAAFALTGMQPYETIDGIEGFPGAFTYNGVHWAAEITSAGEIITLPIVVLITIMAQPRLQFALAQDGLLPPWFAQLDSTGNLWNGTVASGTVMILISSFIPFTHLNDMISAGVLVAFSMTSSSLLLLRLESPSLNVKSSLDGRKNTDSYLMEYLVAIFNASAFTASIILIHFMHSFLQKMLAVILCLTMIMCCLIMYISCPPSKIFGGEKRRQDMYDRVGDNNDFKNSTAEDDENSYFKTPFLPFLPCMAIFVNWYLIAQLELLGIILLVFFLICCGIFYFLYGAKHSVLRKRMGEFEHLGRSAMATNTTGHYHSSNDDQQDEDYDENGQFQNLLRSISLPRVSSKA